MLNNSFLKGIFFKLIVVLSFVLIFYRFSYALDSAPDVQTIQATLGNSTKTVMKLIMLVASIAGISFVAMALFSFKAASDSAGQQNNNLQKGVVKLVIGGALISLPFLLKVSQNSTLSKDLSSTGIYIPSEHTAYQDNAQDDDVQDTRP